MLKWRLRFQQPARNMSTYGALGRRPTGWRLASAQSFLLGELRQQPLSQWRLVAICGSLWIGRHRLQLWCCLRLAPPSTFGVYAKSSWVNILFTSIEIVGLLLVILAALMSEVEVPAAAGAAESSVMAAAALLFFVYLGFEEIANLAEEVRNPGRDIPTALFVSLAVTTGLYIAVALAVVSLAAPSELASSEAPLAAAVQKVWPRAANVLSAIALFATANTVLITVIATSRLAFSMARDREIPSAFAQLLPARQTPWIAAILAFAMAAVLVPIGSVKILAEISSFAALVAFFAVNVVLIVLRYRMPGHKRPFRVPLAIGRLPLLPILAIAAIVLLLIHFEWQIYAAGGIALAASAMSFGVRQWFRKKRR